MIKITLMDEKDFPNHIDNMNSSMRAWTDQAARGESAWICSDCCCSDPNGMPDECFHGHQRCTDIIRRDKKAAGVGIDEA